MLILDEMNGKLEQDAKRIEGYLDTTYLFSYAFFMFFRYILNQRPSQSYEH